MGAPRMGNPLQNQGQGWSAPAAMSMGGGGRPPGMRPMGGPPGGYGGPPGGFRGGPPGGFRGGPPRFRGRGGFGGPPGGFGGPPGFRGRGRGRGRPAPTNVVKKRKAYKGAQPKMPVALPSKQLFIRPIDNDTKTSDVRDFFKVFGELRDVYLPKDYYTKETKGVAYVEYKEQEDAEEAQAAMDGCEFNGKNISVTFAQSDRKSKESMANGTYAMNMEIEMLKKELAKEGDRLHRIKRGEKVSPPREPKKDRSRSRDRDRRKDSRGDGRRDDRRDRRRSRSRDRHSRHDRSRDDRRGGGGRSPPRRGPRPAFRPDGEDKTDDCPEFKMRPRSSRSRSPPRNAGSSRDRGDRGGSSRDDRRDRDRKSRDRRDDRKDRRDDDRHRR